MLSWTEGKTEDGSGYREDGDGATGGSCQVPGGWSYRRRLLSGGWSYGRLLSGWWSYRGIWREKLCQCFFIYGGRRSNKRIRGAEKRAESESGISDNWRWLLPTDWPTFPQTQTSRLSGTISLKPKPPKPLQTSTTALSDIHWNQPTGLPKPLQHQISATTLKSLLSF